LRFGLFYEHQLPRPWEGGGEERLLHDALEQIELADRSGFDYVWEVEHHFLEEYSHSSAPEVFLAAASQRTKRIRLGHGIVQIPPPVNHPARVAERVATLDLVSGGRVDFGTGESSSTAELGGFAVPRADKRAMWHEALDVITRMFVEDPFPGWSGRFVSMPPREVVPRPLQKPHPPLWVACSRRETILLAARNGIGALSFSFVEPEDAGRWATEYYQILTSDECVPAGFAVNPNVAVVVPMMMHTDEGTAIERGIDGAHFFGYSLAHYYGMQHVVGGEPIWDEFCRRRDEAGFARHIVTADQAPLGVRLMQEGLGSLRGAIGTPEQVTDLVRRYEAAGVDQVIFVMQSGRNRHEHICESLELFGSKVLPHFADGREEREAEKAERLAPAVEAALARRAPARELAAPYPMDEDAELARAAHRRVPLRQLVRETGEQARDAVRESTRSGLARMVRGASDARLESVFGRPAVQRLLFTAMARQYDPRFGGGFAGRIGYELRSADGRVSRWAIEVRDGRARAVQGGGDAAVVIRAGVPDFARVAAGSVNQLQYLLDGRMTVEGDLRLASRVADMFGGRSPF
jgi:alkanesulfonate monooxygenase SsuD/methylene tetrahydromethanopterin reductase-like flavin-dependent oxidoreductase (luciferase family)